MNGLTKDSTPAEWRAAWVEALRSGDYQQDVGTLRRSLPSGDVAGFCCLGVACDLAAKAGIGSWVRGGFIGTKRGDFSGSMLPDEVQRLFGLVSPAGRLRGGHQTGTLMGANDRGVPFAEIADLIESGAVITTDGAE